MMDDETRKKVWYFTKLLFPSGFVSKTLTEEEILHFFEQCDAVWIHDGDPKKPHAELTSGKCSNGFFDCMRVLKYPLLGQILAQQLIRRLPDDFETRADFNWVVGSAYADITFSYEVAKHLGATHGFVEKDPKDPAGKKMVWPRLTIQAGSMVLQVEELITTSGTFKEVRRAILEGNAELVEFYPLVACIIHRPPKLPVDYDGIKVISLIEREVWAVDPKDCPLCKAGSLRYRPKTHWRELTGKS